MISEKIQNFRTISDLQKYLDGLINELKKSSEELSKLIGEKLRITDSIDDVELQEFRQKIEGSTPDSKKKKNIKKKDQKANWHNLDSISVYDGMGLKGELEIYFKAMEYTKSELDKVTKIKQSIDDLVNRGLKKDLGCVMIINHELPAEVALIKSVGPRKKFAYKSILSVPAENFNAI